MVSKPTRVPYTGRGVWGKVYMEPSLSSKSDSDQAKVTPPTPSIKEIDLPFTLQKSRIFIFN